MDVFDKEENDFDQASDHEEEAATPLDTMLIELIRQNGKFLYNSSLRQSMDKNAKLNFWRDAGRMLSPVNGPVKYSAGYLAKRWEYLRNYYRRLLRKRKIFAASHRSNANGRSFKTKWPHFEALDAFLSLKNTAHNERATFNVSSTYSVNGDGQKCADNETSNEVNQLVAAIKAAATSNSNSKFNKQPKKEIDRDFDMDFATNQLQLHSDAVAQEFSFADQDDAAADEIDAINNDEDFQSPSGSHLTQAMLSATSRLSGAFSAEKIGSQKRCQNNNIHNPLAGITTGGIGRQKATVTAPYVRRKNHLQCDGELADNAQWNGSITNQSKPVLPDAEVDKNDERGKYIGHILRELDDYSGDMAFHEINCVLMKYKYGSNLVLPNLSVEGASANNSETAAIG